MGAPGGAVIYFSIVEFRGNFWDSIFNSLPRDHSKLHYLEMSIKGKSACQFHSLYDRKTGAIHEAKILIAVFCENLPGALFVGRGDGNHPHECAFLQLLPENARSLVTDAVADEGNGFREDSIGGNERECVGSEECRRCPVVGIIGIHQCIPSAGIHENTIHFFFP